MTVPRSGAVVPRALALSLAAIAMWGCTKPSASSDAGSPVPGAGLLTPERTTVRPFQVLTLTDPAATFAEASYPGRLGDAEVALITLSPTRLGVLVPTLPPGSATLTVEGSGLAYAEVTLTVDPEATLPSEPGAYVRAWQAAAVESVAAAGTGTTDPVVLETVRVAQSELGRFGAQFETLSSAEQQQVALLLSELEVSSRFNLTDYGLRVVRQSARVALTIVLIATAVKIAGTPGALPFAAVVAAVGGAAFATETTKLHRLLADGESEPILLVEAAAEDSLFSTSRALTPFPFLDGVPAAMPVFVRMENLSAASLTSSHPLVREIVDAVLSVEREWDRWVAWLSVVFPPPRRLSDVARIEARQPAAPEVLTVRSKSADVVLVSQAAAAGGLVVTFSFASTVMGQPCAAAMPVPFTFELTYDDGVFPARTVQAMTTLGCAGPPDYEWSRWPAPADVNPGFSLTAETATDLLTGLTWQRAHAPARKTWQAAVSDCEALTLGGFDDWRLPTRVELSSILDLGVVTGPLVDTNVFPGTPDTDSFWTSTPVPGSGNHYLIYMGTGSDRGELASVPVFARCVR